MLLVCVALEPFLVVTLVSQLRSGQMLGALFTFIAMGLIGNIAVGIWDGDITF